MSEIEIPSSLNESKVDMLNYYYFTDVFTSEEINEIINLCEDLKLNDVIEEDSLRRSKVGYLSPQEETLWIYEKIFLLSETANEEMGWDFQIDGIYDDIEYSIYENGSGQYIWYSDINSSPNNKLHITINLSTDKEYSGGELEFNLGGDESLVNPSSEVGSMVVAPSYILGRTTPILSGVKRTLKLSISGIKFR